MNGNVGSHVFLLGPHGCGKSTIGRHLAAQGYAHISIGLIGRLARRAPARPTSPCVFFRSCPATSQAILSIPGPRSNYSTTQGA